MSHRLLLLGLVFGVGACSSTVADRGFSDPNAPEGATPGSGGGFGNTTPTETDADGCVEAAKLVYVMTLEGDLYSFAPADKKFTKVGALDCQSAGGTPLVPISMAVERNATAWVNMRPQNATSSMGELYKVDTKTAACTPSGIRYEMGGMGFSTNAGSKDQETLFMIGRGTTNFAPALLRVDFAGKRLVHIADVPEPTDLELTGTGDGRLYGFLMNDPLELAAVNKTSSAFTQRVSLAQVTPPMAPMYAFSFWGGDFYFYTATSPSPSTSTTVFRHRPATGRTESYMTQIGFHIVGAGVSTCAPTVAPK
jgi:hypothetical protein